MEEVPALVSAWLSANIIVSLSIVLLKSIKDTHILHVSAKKLFLLLASFTGSL
jgi:hypothetical protein